MLRFILHLKELEFYLQLWPLNQTLVSWCFICLLFFFSFLWVVYLSAYGLLMFTILLVRLVSAPKDEGFKQPETKVSVKILLHYSGDLAAKFPYNQVNLSQVGSLWREMLGGFVFWHFFFHLCSSRLWWMLCVKSLRLFGMLKKGLPFQTLSYAMCFVVVCKESRGISLGM